MILNENMKNALEENGYVLCGSSVGTAARKAVCQSVFRTGEIGARCLLDIPIVAEVTVQIGRDLMNLGLLGNDAVAIQAIAFDKSSIVNWKVTWHQDLMFPFAKPVSHSEYMLPCVKNDINFARPPQSVLEQLLAVRLHLDNCDEENGPLRVVSGSHTLGIISSTQIQKHVEARGEVVCTADEGEILLMRPLLLHASSKASEPRRRRVLHLVYHSGVFVAEEWHRTLQLKQSLKSALAIAASAMSNVASFSDQTDL